MGGVKREPGAQNEKLPPSSLPNRKTARNVSAALESLPPEDEREVRNLQNFILFPLLLEEEAAALFPEEDPFIEDDLVDWQSGHLDDCLPHKAVWKNWIHFDDRDSLSLDTTKQMASSSRTRLNFSTAPLNAPAGNSFIQPESGALHRSIKNLRLRRTWMASQQLRRELAHRVEAVFATIICVHAPARDRCWTLVPFRVSQTAKVLVTINQHYIHDKPQTWKS